MSMLRLTPVLELLGKEARLGWTLAAAKPAAWRPAAEPVLFGRIVDVLSGKPAAARCRRLGPGRCWRLGGFGLFTILCSARWRSTPTSWRIASASGTDRII